MIEIVGFELNVSSWGLQDAPNVKANVKHEVRTHRHDTLLDTATD